MGRLPRTGISIPVIAVTRAAALMLRGGASAAPSAVNLRTADAFAVLDGQTGAVALQAQNDVTVAYDTVAGLACDEVLTGQDLGGMTLTAGVYCFSSSAQLTGTLTLDRQGDPEAEFVFQVGSTLTTASASTVLLTGQAQPCRVFHQVGSSATLGTGSQFVGTTLALTSITATTGVSVQGRLLARNGAVTLDTNNVMRPMCLAPVTTSSTVATTRPTVTTSPTTATTMPNGSTATTTPNGATATTSATLPATTPRPVVPAVLVTTGPRSGSPSVATTTTKPRAQATSTRLGSTAGPLAAPVAAGLLAIVAGAMFLYTPRLRPTASANRTVRKPDRVGMNGRRSTRRPRSRLALLVMMLVGAVLLPARGALAANPAPVDLGAAAPFGVLAGTAVANTGASAISGDIGSTPGVSITGFPPGTLTGTTHPGGAVASQAQSALSAAYLDAAARTADQSLTGDLAGKTLTPGVYRYGVAAQLTGTVILDAQGDPDAVFIFQIGTTLGSAAGSTVSLINGAQACHTFWQIGTSSTLGANTAFRGSMLASESITVGVGTSVAGRLLARTGTVTMDTNTVTPTTCALDITSPLATDFAGRYVTGVGQTTTAALGAFSVSDTRGNGAGWHVTAQASAFIGVGLRQLAAGSLSMSKPGVTAGTGATLSGLTVADGPYVIDNGAVSIASAALTAGTGTYLFASTTLTLALPAAVYADAYGSTVTISVVSGP